MTSRAVLVAGAGDVGIRVGQALVRRGDRVVALRRDITKLPPELDGRAADLTDPETLRRLPQGLDALVFCGTADRRDEAAYRALYVDGLRNVLAAVGRIGCVVFTSTTGVYGQVDGTWVDELSLTAPSSFTGRVMLEAEAVALDVVALDAVALGVGRAHVLRLGGIYGPGRTRLLGQVRRGEATYVAGGRQYTNRIHRDDAADAIVHVIDQPNAPAVLNVVDDYPAERGEVLRWLAEALDAPTPRAVAPTSSMVDDGKRVSNARLRALGWRPRFPSYRDGYAAVIKADPASSAS